MFRFLKPLIAACTLAAGVAHAFPERPITIVVPYAPGGAADAVPVWWPPAWVPSWAAV